MDINLNLFNRKIEKLDFFVYSFFAAIMFIGIIAHVIIKLESGFETTDKVFIGGGIAIFAFLVINIISYFKTKNQVSPIVSENMRQQSEMPIENIQSVSVETLSQEEMNYKSYIETNKSKFSKDIIKSELLKSGVSESKLDEYLNKYY